MRRKPAVPHNSHGGMMMRECEAMREIYKREGEGQREREVHVVRLSKRV
jgi:hypothetical protein